MSSACLSARHREQAQTFKTRLTQSIPDFGLEKGGNSWRGLRDRVLLCADHVVRVHSHVVLAVRIPADPSGQEHYQRLCVFRGLDLNEKREFAVSMPTHCAFSRLHLHQSVFGSGLHVQNSTPVGEDARQMPCEHGAASVLGIMYLKSDPSLQPTSDVTDRK